VVVDAVLLSGDEVSIVFSFARSYFFVEMDRPGEMVDWLLSIMPLKPVSELYAAVASTSTARPSCTARSCTCWRRPTTASSSPRQRGMVMCVFTLPASTSSSR